MSLIEIFKAGKQTSSSGKSVELTVDDLQKIADNYNEKVAEGGDTYKAPLVIGHPTADAPAYGWAASLSVDRDAGKLLATPERVDEGLKGLVAEGKYTRVSASLYTPDSPHSPAKDGYFLRHIGFLGAMAPAVKGLKAVSFSDAEEGVLSFGDEEAKTAGVLQRLVNFVAKQFGKDQADAIMFGETAEAPATEPAAAAPAPAAEAAPAAPAEPATGTPVGQEAAPAAAAPSRVADFAEQEAQLASKAAELADRENALLDAEIENFAETLITSGRVLPVSKSAVTTLFKTLSAAGSIDFAEGEQRPAADVFKDLLNSLPPVVTFKEVATDESGPAPGELDFAIAPGYTADPDEVAKVSKAKALVAQNPELTLIQAYSRI